MVSFDDFAGARLRGNAPLPRQKVKKGRAVASQVPAVTFGDITEAFATAQDIGAGFQKTGASVSGGGGGPLDFVGSAIEKFTDIVPTQIDDRFVDIVGDATDLDIFEKIRRAGEATGDAITGVIGGPINRATGGLLFDEFSETGGAPVPIPGTGRPVGVGQLAVGGQVPAMGTITKMWDTWPGAGVTGGGRAPIFFRTIDGKTFVRKIDGSIKKVPRSRNLVLNTRKINLNTYIKMDKAIEKITSRLTKKSKRLKRS